MKHIFCATVWLVAFLIGGALFWTSNQVQLAESETAKWQVSLSGHDERMAVLAAEWNFLNNPAYLETVLAALKKGDVSRGAMVLAGVNALPSLKVAVLPVRKPVETILPVAVLAESAPVAVEPALVAKTKTVQSKDQYIKPESRKFAFVLASWAQ